MWKYNGMIAVTPAICFFILTLFTGFCFALEAVHSGFNAPTGIASGPDGSLYITNWGGGTVEKITSNGERTVFLDGIASPAGIAVDSEGVVYVSAYSGDYVVRVDTSGNRTWIAEGLATPTGIALTGDGRLLIANRASGEVVALTLQTGEKRIVADSLSLPVGVVSMPDDSLVVSQYGGRVTRVLPDRTKQELGQNFTRPGVGILADGDNAVLVVDNGASVVRRVAFTGETNTISEMLPGSAVALGRERDGGILAGTWGTGGIYRLTNR